jgi:predicted small lipoprotein YifL
MRYITVIVFVLALAACGSNGPATVEAHGSFDID